MTSSKGGSSCSNGFRADWPDASDLLQERGQWRAETAVQGPLNDQQTADAQEQRNPEQLQAAPAA